MSDFDPARLVPHLRSFVNTPPGFVAIHRDYFLETEQDLNARKILAAKADAWVEGAGGHRFKELPPARRGLRPGRIVAPPAGPATEFYAVPAGRLPRPPSSSPE